MGRGGMDGRTDGRTDGCLEIHPCVLQDLGPLGPLPKKANTVIQQYIFFMPVTKIVTKKMIELRIHML